MGIRLGNPASVVSVTGTSAAADAARQPSSAAVCQEGPPVGIGVAAIVELLPVVVPFTVLGPAPLPPDTGSNRAGDDGSQVGVAGGAPDGGWDDAAEADGVPDAAAGRRVRNQADSSSRKIGSSIVSSGRPASADGRFAVAGGRTGAGAGAGVGEGA